MREIVVAKVVANIRKSLFGRALPLLCDRVRYCNLTYLLATLPRVERDLTAIFSLKGSRQLSYLEGKIWRVLHIMSSICWPLRIRVLISKAVYFHTPEMSRQPTLQNAPKPGTIKLWVEKKKGKNANYCVTGPGYRDYRTTSALLTSTPSFNPMQSHRPWLAWSTRNHSLHTLEYWCASGWLLEYNPSEQYTIKN
jgi:hypothetical protein